MQKKTLVVFWACVFTCPILLAQPSFAPINKREAAKITQNEVAFVVKEMDARVVKRLKSKPKDLKAYEASLNTFNDLLKEIVVKEWDISKSIKVISEAEAGKLKEEKTQGLSLIEIGEIHNYKQGDFYDAGPGGFNSASSFAWHMSRVGSSVALIITHADNPKRELVVSYLPVHGVTKGTVTFMVRHLKSQIVDCVSKDITSWGDLKKVVEANTINLKSKTLLFFEPVADKEVINAVANNKIEEHYSLKCEVLPSEEAEQILIEKNENYALVWVVPAGASNQAGELYNYFVIDASDGHPLFVTGHGTTGMPYFGFRQLSVLNKKLK
jgi:hypothetical protein